MKHLALLTLLFASSAVAQAPHDPARLYPHEAEVDALGATGLVRLPLPTEVLSRVRPDFSDVRLHDASGREIPYVVDSGAREADLERYRFRVDPVGVERRIVEDGSLAAIFEERLEVLTPGAVPSGARWRIALDAASARFVRDVRVLDLGSDGDAPRELARATVFRLPDPRRERLVVELPAIEPARRLAIEVRGEGGYLEPTIDFLGTRAPLTPPVLELPLEERARRVEDGRTIVELARPFGLAPDRIRLVTTTGHFARPVRVIDSSQTRAPTVAGEGVAFRARELGLEQLSVELALARGTTLRVEIDDGDSGALADLSIVAEVRQPILIFEGSAAPTRLRFGGGRARPPSYDLVRLASLVGDSLLDHARPSASIGPVRDNPAFDDGPALRFAMNPGRTPEASRFSHAADVVVEGAREGLSRVRIPPAVVALAREDLADLRIVDEEGRQWPYLRAPVLETDRVEASFERRTTARGSTYAVRPPDGRAPIDRLRLHTDTSYVARGYVLYAVDADGARAELSRGELRRDPGELAPLEVFVSTRWVERLELDVQDGSDAPLELTRVELDVPTPTFFLAASDGAYRLLVGDPAAAPPRYEIERARELILAVRAAEARVEPPRANPAHVAPPWYQAADAHTLIVWAVLLFAVLVLGVLTLRLARRVEPTPSAAPTKEPEPPAEDGPAKEQDDDPSEPPLTF